VQLWLTVYTHCCFTHCYAPLSCTGLAGWEGSASPEAVDTTVDTAVEDYDDGSISVAATATTDVSFNDDSERVPGLAGWEQELQQLAVDVEVEDAVELDETGRVPGLAGWEQQAQQGDAVQQKAVPKAAAAAAEAAAAEPASDEATDNIFQANIAAADMPFR
jgi:hypothetical protein